MVEKVDTKTVIYRDVEIALPELEATIAEMPELNFIHIDHSHMDGVAGENLIQIARKNPDAKQKLLVLVNAGFHLYVLRDGMSSFVRHRRIPTLWRDVVEGKNQVDENGIIYRFEPAEVPDVNPRLLVIFSSIAGPMYQSSLYRHFEINFGSISKYIPKNTHILRIADLGGVCGSFYLNSNSLPDNEANVANCISQHVRKLGLKKSDVTLYGVSKGGTGAVLHGVRSGYKTVAVDPILDDEHYVVVYNDSHFTEGAFPRGKAEVFTDVFSDIHNDAVLSVIASSRSPQFKYIKRLIIDPFSDKFSILNSLSTAIMDHPDVGPSTIPHTLAQINSHLAGIPVPAGLFEVF